MKFGSLFTGIGGLDLGLERAGMQCAWQVENNPFCTKILEKHWPSVKRFTDIKQERQLPSVDLLAGGFPCQPFSSAGKGKAENDDRNMWPEMRRIVQLLRPRWVLAENVSALSTKPYFDTILDNLEDLAYKTWPIEIPAAAVGAPHLRYRTFIMLSRLIGPTG